MNLIFLFIALVIGEDEEIIVTKTDDNKHKIILSSSRKGGLSSTDRTSGGVSKDKDDSLTTFERVLKNLKEMKDEIINKIDDNTDSLIKQEYKNKLARIQKEIDGLDNGKLKEPEPPKEVKIATSTNEKAEEGEEVFIRKTMRGDSILKENSFFNMLKKYEVNYLTIIHSLTIN